MRRTGPRSSGMRCQRIRTAWRRWWQPRKRKRRFTGSSWAKRTRYAARWRKLSRTRVTDLMDTPFSMYQVGAEALLPPRDISVSQWADENVVLTGSGSAERGQWHTRPYQREPMD